MSWESSNPKKLKEFRNTGELLGTGSWHDCINPLGKPAHAHFFEVSDQITLYYANKLCPMCWNLVKKHWTHESSTAPGWFEKKYPKRNDRADIVPSKDYD